MSETDGSWDFDSKQRKKASPTDFNCAQIYESNIFRRVRKRFCSTIWFWIGWYSIQRDITFSERRKRKEKKKRIFDWTALPKSCSCFSCSFSITISSFSFFVIYSSFILRIRLVVDGIISLFFVLFTRRLNTIQNDFRKSFFVAHLCVDQIKFVAHFRTRFASFVQIQKIYSFTLAAGNHDSMNNFECDFRFCFIVLSVDRPLSSHSTSIILRVNWQESNYKFTSCWSRAVWVAVR